MRTLKDCDDLFISMHFSDQYNMSTTLASNGDLQLGIRALDFQFRLPSTRHMERLRPLLKMVMYFIDLVGTHRLTAQAHAASVSKRRLVAEHIRKANQRQEAARKEEKKKGDTTATQELTEAQLRKREAKEAKAAAKKNKPRVKIIR